MKALLLVVVARVCTALAADPCCGPGELMMSGGYCGNRTERINLNCTLGHMLLKDVTLKGNKLSTYDAPNYVFAEDPKDYCIGTMKRDENNTKSEEIKAAVVCFQEFEQNNDIEISGYLTLVSAVFLILTFAVYAFLQQLRDLQGLCYMSMCVSMALGFLSLGVIQLSPGFRGETCTVTGFLIYFWMMATFFWMNIICINVYRSVLDANYLKRTERKQYFYYCCYGWGSPILMLFVALVTNYVDGDHMKPGIGDTTCWFQGREETWLFFYGPIAILIAANVGLFVMSSYNLWKETRRYEVSRLNNLKYKFLLSLKLFLVMGLSWIFEIASFAHGQRHIIWKIMDIFNCLQGIVIFILLVVFRKRVVQCLAKEGICLFCTRPLMEKLSPHDDGSEDEHMLADDQTEVRLD